MNMKEPNKTWNDQDKKKLVIKMGGGGGGGGVGAVVLLGGALATAALASAFIVGWSSSRDRRRRQSPPPNMKKQNEEDEANKGQQFTFLDQPSHVYEHPSNGATKEVDSDDTSGLLVSKQSLTLDDKPRIEVNGRKPGDASEASEEILCSISPKKLETNAISAVVEEGFCMLDEKLPFEPKNMMHGNDELRIQLTKEDVANEIPEESKNLEQIHIEEVGAEREATDDVEIERINHREAVVVTETQPREEENSEVCYEQEEIEVTIVDNAVEGVHNDRNKIEVVTIVDNAVERVDIDQKEGQKNVNVEEKELEGLGGDSEESSEEECEEAIEKTEDDLAVIGWESTSEDRICANQDSIGGTDGSLSETIVSESNSKDGEKTLLPVFESPPVVEYENVNRDEKEGDFPTEIVEIIKEDEAVEVSQEDQMKYVEEEQQLVKEEEKCDPLADGIVSEKCEEVGWTGEVNKSNPQTEVGEPKIPCENKEENTCLNHPIPAPTGNREFSVPVLKEELISPQDVEVTEEGAANEEDAESLEVNENKALTESFFCQPKDSEDDIERSIGKELEEELIPPQNSKEDFANEEVAENMEVNETKTSEQFVIGQPKQQVEGNTAEEVEDSSAVVDTGIIATKDDSIMEMNEDDDKGEENVKDSEDDTDSSDEVEESSVESGDSSTESNSDAVWPAQSPQEASMETQQVKLIGQEVEGKVQEDKAGREGEHDFQRSQGNGKNSYFEAHQVKAEGCNSEKSNGNFPTMVDSSQFPDGKGELEKSFINKYVANASRRTMLIAALSVLSSLSCSWFFGLSSVKLCLIVFLTMVLAKLHGY